MQTLQRMCLGLAFSAVALCATACREETVRKSEEAAEAAGEDIKAGAGKAIEKTREVGREVAPALEEAGRELREEGEELRREAREETVETPETPETPRARSAGDAGPVTR